MEPTPSAATEAPAIDRTAVERRAAQLINLIKTRFVLPNGLLSRQYPPRDRTIFDNFDDLAPFFLFFGEEEFLLKQVRLIRKNGDTMISLCMEDGVLATSAIDEWFGGLHALWTRTRDPSVFELLNESVEFVLSHLFDGDFLSAAFVRNRGPMPFYEPWSAGLLETFCEMRGEFPQAFERAQTTMRAWVNEEYFKRYGLFPYRVFRSKAKNLMHHFALSHLPPRSHTRAVSPARSKKPRELLRTALMHFRFETTTGWYSQLMKSNSTPAFTLLELHRATGESFWLDCLERWIKAALEAFCEGGLVYSEYLPMVRRRCDPAATPAFIMVDVLCDAARAHPERFERHLSHARAILDEHWQQRGAAGLIPEATGSTHAPQAHTRAHIDRQVDFSVSLRRYAELTGDNAYRARAATLMLAALERHGTPDGFITFTSDSPLSEVTRVIDPKYNALVLKGLANLLTLDEPLYGKYDALFKDR